MRRTASSLCVALSACLIAAGSAGSKEKEAEKSHQEAAKSPQATAYSAYVAAVKAGDVEAWKKLVPSWQANELELDCKLRKKTPKELMAWYAEIPPDDMYFVSVSVKGNEATLRLTGKRKSGEKVKGEVSLLLEDGSWKIAGQSGDN